MPFIHRVVEEHTGPSAGIIRTPWRGHVSEAELLPTDELVEPTPEELAVLQAQWPEEYADGPPAALVYTEANAAEAILLIKGQEDLDLLAEWFEHELAGPKRKTVLAAFAEKGLVAGDGE